MPCNAVSVVVSRTGGCGSRDQNAGVTKLTAAVLGDVNDGSVSNTLIQTMQTPNYAKKEQHLRDATERREEKDNDKVHSARLRDCMGRI